MTQPVDVRPKSRDFDRKEQFLFQYSDICHLGDTQQVGTTNDHRICPLVNSRPAIQYCRVRVTCFG